MIDILIVWGVTIFLSVVFLSIAILVIEKSVKHRESATDRWGVKRYFYSGRNTNLIWFLLLVPVLNAIVSVIALTCVLTDLEV